MNLEALLTLVGNEPVFSSALLLAGQVSIQQERLQLSRWVRAGKLIQLRRGLYALAPAWRKTEPHPFVIANAMHHGSYVSLQSALAFHGAIPEHVPVVTSVGPGRPEIARNALGAFALNHITKALSFGYTLTEVAPRQSAFVATAEKALLDLVYLTPGGDSIAYLRELRLQNTDAFQVDILLDMATRSGRPKLIRAAQRALTQLTDEQEATS